MYKMLGFGTFMIGLLLVMPVEVHGQKKAGNVEKASADDYKSLARNKEIAGIIVTADAKALTFRIETTRVQPGAGKGRPGYAKVVRFYKEFEVDVSDAVVVKKMFVDADYDDKGNFKVDAAAAKELRSKGFIASKIENVKSGNIVRLVLAAPKKGDEVAGVGNVATPVVKTIYLQKQGTPVEPAKTMEKKKKK